ncbi:E3 ubiquitin-protein ligase rad18 [Zygosaccharomyces mellis]|uniref:Postreplication repair E3 ubiquitin-protein ligase RAD18 n=1 Tax=Zygosaccharomyces mellis TaxID=42258 RepID=A0A4C2E4Q9_9SACH|nr:E3 ubiquitin-protein ligase rad18 [Zygosaccharomyces mellis]
MDYSVSDPTDFSHTSIPQLSQLDTLVRCHICKDLLKIPVLTPCSHTFCSLCIREYLTREPKCPLCLNELRESSLRSEFLVSEIIESYRSVRDALLESLMKNQHNDNGESLIELTDDDNDDDLEIVGTNSREVNKDKNENSVGKITKPSTSSGVNSLLSSQRNKSNTKEQLAQCPICSGFYPIQALERTHLDECLTMQTLDANDNIKKRRPTPPIPQIKSPKSSSKPKRGAGTKDDVSHVDKYLSSFNTDQRRERLPKINFASMNLSQIKQKLMSLNLPTYGSRQNMITRYNHYEILWNSNFCDAIEPVDESELRRQLTSWEASHNPSNSNNSTNIISKMMRRANQGNSYQKLLADFKNDNFQRKSWIHMFRKDFKNLLKEAKRSIPRSPKTIDNVENQITAPENTEKA